ncbi:MAG: apolipoprotein N-acyltransferase [bacterium]|nr:apolipoprotein N-acyltransferase [bacterium]
MKPLPGRLTLAGPWLLAAFAGISLSLALPSLAWWPLLAVFPGLLLESIQETERFRQGFLLGLVAGTVHWIVSVQWVVPVMNHYGGLPLAAAIACLLFMSVILGLSWALITLVLTKLSIPTRILLFPALWCAIDASRQFAPYAFPWNPTAASFWRTPALLGSLPTWGATGLAWAAVACGSGLWALLRPTTRRLGIGLIAVALCLTVAFSLLAPEFETEGGALSVAALQPGTSLEEKWDPNQWREIVNNVWKLSRAAAGDGATVILWPEGAVPFSLDSDRTYQTQVVALAQELNASIMLNSIASGDNGGTMNSAFLVTQSGVSPRRYDKNNLVPFGEYVPSWARLAFTEALVREVGSFTPGNSHEPLQADVQLGVGICYEIIFADLIAAQTRAGAEVLTTLTNDGWYGFSSAPSQHFSQAVLRAAENRRWVIRAALTGISGLVDPYGRIVQTLEIGETGFVRGEVMPSRYLTPRTRFGDWWAWVCAGMCVTFIAIEVARKRRQGKN